MSSSAPDPTPGNDNVSEDTTANISADLQIVKTGPVTSVAAGSAFNYTLLVTNAGPSDANNVVVTDVIPLTVTYVTSSNPACSYNSGNRTVTCNLGTMTPTTNTTFTITVQVDPARAAGTFTNTASVSPTINDPNTTNNSESETTTVFVSADITITKSDSPEALRPGETLTYTLVVTNTGPSNAVGVSVSDPLPGLVDWVSTTTTQGTCSGTTTVNCTIGTLTPNEAEYFYTS